MSNLDTLLEQVEVADFNQIQSILRAIIVHLIDDGADDVETEKTQENAFAPHTTVPADVTTEVIGGTPPENNVPVVPGIPVEPFVPVEPTVPVDPLVPPVNNAPDANPVPTPHMGV